MCSLLAAVKKFPRKGRDESTAGIKRMTKQKGAKMQKGSTATADAAKLSPMVSLAPVKGEEGSDFEDHFEQIKLTSSSSPETSYQICDTGIPQLFNYDTAQESVLACGSPANCTPPGTGATVSRTNSTSSASPKGSPQHMRKVSVESEAAQMKRLGAMAEATNVSQLKKPKLELARTQTPQTTGVPHMCRVTGADTMTSSSTLVHSSNSSTPYTTPHGTPCHSPLPSSSSPHQFRYYSTVSTSQGEDGSGYHHPVCSSSHMDSPLPAHLSQLGMTLSSRGSPSTGNIIITSQPTTGTFLPFHVVPVGQVGSSLFPMVHFAGHFPHHTAGSSQSMIGKSPFHMVPIPTNSKPVVTNGGPGVSSTEVV